RPRRACCERAPSRLTGACCFDRACAFRLWRDRITVDHGQLLEQAAGPRRDGGGRIARHEDFKTLARAAELSELQLFASFGDEEGCDALIGSFLPRRFSVSL